MLTSPTLSWALTAVFAVTGAAALVRLARPVRAVPSDRPDERVAELAHLLMSVAMIAMVWGRSGGPGTVLGTAQIAVFALLAVVLLLSATRPGRAHGRAAAACHLLTTLAMVWMVAATPDLVGDGGTMDMGGGTPTGGGVDVAVDVAVVVALVVVAAWWAARARRLVPAGHGLAAACHLLMSLGMASMLLAML